MKNKKNKHQKRLESGFNSIEGSLERPVENMVARAMQSFDVAPQMHQTYKEEDKESLRDE